MTLADKLHDWLGTLAGPDVDAAFGEALEFAEPDWAGRIEKTLLQRANDASWAALAARYDALSDDARERLCAPDEKVVNGIGMALRSGSPAGRLNAIRAIEDHGDPRMAYLLAEALRDPSSSVRGSAATTLRLLAGSLANLDPPREDDGGEAATRWWDRRRGIVDALEQGLRIFHIHHRVEVIEAALWYARDLEDVLWLRIESPRSPFAKVIRDNLAVWDGPQLAGFHITALVRAAWAGESLQLLRQWDSLAHLIALLRESAALDNPLVRAKVVAIRAPRWFSEAGTDLARVPPPLRPHAARWVRHLGFEDSQRVAILSRWLRSPDMRLSNAAAFALADAATPAALDCLRDLMHESRPAGRFARWFILAHDNQILGSSSRGAPPAPDTDLEAAHTDFVLLWRACRRAPANERGPLIQVIREHAEMWRPRLRAHLQSPDARDRLLALQVLSTTALSTRFHRDIQAMGDDPVEGLRRLAATLIGAVPDAPDAAPEAPTPAVPRGSAGDQRRVALHELLDRLASGDADARDDRVAAELRKRLREIYGGAAGANEGNSE